MREMCEVAHKAFNIHFTRVFYLFHREKAKWKEREEAWLKIDNLAKSNPQVIAYPGGFKTSKYDINLRISRYSFIQFCLFKQLTELLFPLCTSF